MNVNIDVINLKYILQTNILQQQEHKRITINKISFTRRVIYKSELVGEIQSDRKS